MKTETTEREPTTAVRWSALLGIVFAIPFSIGVWGIWNMVKVSMPLHSVLFWSLGFGILFLCAAKYYRDELKRERQRDEDEPHFPAVPPEPSAVRWAEPERNAVNCEPRSRAVGVKEGEERSKDSEENRDEGKALVHDVLIPNAKAQRRHER